MHSALENIWTRSCVLFTLPVVAPKNPSDPAQLSVKQKMFADAILEGKNSTLADAYRSVYQTENMSARTARNEASNLYRHPGVTAYMERARERVESDRARRAVGERESVRVRLWGEADDADRSSDRIAALRLLGQAAGMFAERVEIAEVSAERSDAEILAELEATLASALE